MRTRTELAIPAGRALLPGTLTLPTTPRGIVLFAHGSGSSRHSPRNTFVSDVLLAAGVGTLLFDLLTVEEDRNYATRFDIALLSDRLARATSFLRQEPQTRAHPFGYFGASTGAAAALVAAAAPGADIAAIVSRGGRPDLAGERALTEVSAPTLLIVGGEDHEVIALNRSALASLRCEKELRIVPGATHLFEEPGTLHQVAALASEWFARWMSPAIRG